MAESLACKFALSNAGFGKLYAKGLLFSRKYGFTGPVVRGSRGKLGNGGDMIEFCMLYIWLWILDNAFGDMQRSR